MSKKCAKCEKTVYPTEEFRCLDKVMMLKPALIIIMRARILPINNP